MDKTSRRTFVLDLRKRVLYEHGWSLGCSEIGDEDRNAEEYAFRESVQHITITITICDCWAKSIGCFELKRRDISFSLLVLCKNKKGWKV